MFDTLMKTMILYGCKIWGYSISRETLRKIEQNDKHFIIKSNIPYTIPHLDVALPPLEIMSMIKYLMYNNKIINMNIEKACSITSNIGKVTQDLREGGVKIIFYVSTIGGYGRRPHFKY
jgi:hypothetical protein